MLFENSKLSTIYKEPQDFNNFYNIKYKNIICCNCGENGHSYKKCSNPVTSFGVICFKTDDLKSIKPLIIKDEWKKTFSINPSINPSLKFLLIKRKDTLAFAEFVRVKYNIYDIEYVKKLLENMTQDELNFLQNASSPDEIWNKLWTLKKNSKPRIIEFNKIKKKLILLLNGIQDKNGENITLKNLTNNISSKRNDLEW